MRFCLLKLKGDFRQFYFWKVPTLLNLYKIHFIKNWRMSMKIMAKIDGSIWTKFKVKSYHVGYSVHLLLMQQSKLALPPHNRHSMCRHWLEQHRWPMTYQCWFKKLQIKSIDILLYNSYLSAAARADSAPEQSAASIFILWNYFWIPIFQNTWTSTVLNCVKPLVATQISLYIWTRDLNLLKYFFWKVSSFNVYVYTFLTLQ